MVDTLAEIEAMVLLRKAASNNSSFSACWGGEMVDTLALGASAARRGGSSPLPSTLRRSGSCSKTYHVFSSPPSTDFIEIVSTVLQSLFLRP